MHAYVLAEAGVPEILRRLAAHCRFNVAAERALALGPSGDRSTVAFLAGGDRRGGQSANQFAEISIGGARDIRDLAERAAKGARLQPLNLLQVLDMLVAARTLRPGLPAIARC